MDKREQIDNFITVYYPLSERDPSVAALIMNDRLQEFAQRVAFISGLAINKKLDCEEYLQQLRLLWKRLKAIRKELYPAGNRNKQVRSSFLTEISGATCAQQLLIFARKLGLLVSLEVGGKIDPLTAYRLVKRLYNRLKKSLGCD